VAVVCRELNFEQVELAPVVVKFRDLSDAEIESYLLRETPYD
jgi:septum formation protein